MCVISFCHETQFFRYDLRNIKSIATFYYTNAINALIHEFADGKNFIDSI